MSTEINTRKDDDFGNPPQSRVEKILMSEVIKPKSRIEKLLLEGGGGGGGTSNVQDIVFTLDPTTYVITLYLVDGEGTQVGTTRTIDLPLESTVVSLTYDNITKSIIFTLVSGAYVTVPIGDIVYGLQPLIDSSHKLSAALVDDTQGRVHFTWVGTAAQYAIDGPTLANGTPVYITDDTDMDTTPTQGSDNPVTSDGLYTALAAKEDKSDNVILPKSDFDALVSKTAKLYYVYPDPVVSGLQSLSPNLSQDLQQPVSLDVIDEPTAETETEVLPDDSGESE